MEGLAASVAQQPQQAPNNQIPNVDEVVALLMEGIPPEELEKMGIPPEVIVRAIEILEQQMSQQQPQQASIGGGLAEQAIGM